MSDPTRQRIVATHPAMTSVGVERNLRFGGSAEVPLHLDLYRPPNAKGSLSPVVVFVSGYSDPGFAKVVGCRFKEMGAYVSWAELLAANGITAVTYENVDPPTDAQTLLDYLRDQAEQLDIDPKRMAIWAASGNAPTALALMDRNELTCAVVSYGYLLDLDGHTDVADAAAQFRFSNAIYAPGQVKGQESTIRVHIGPELG